VDRVSEVLTIPDEEIVPPPEINKMGNKYIKGIGKVGNEVKLLLDCYKLLSEEDIENLSNG
jgi:purine-binding chemotaxis protein CheW